ncbi:MAG: CmpA/NrtA family ABC transporter substrate-binding protein [Pseudomonadota bacterium]
MTQVTLRAGFIPLVDAAPLIVAREIGVARAHDIDLQLSRSTSWAAVRDRLSVGDVDCAHMLSPIVIASQLGLGNAKAPMIAPAGLSMNGNAISVSTELYQEMHDVGWSADMVRNPATSAVALAKIIRKRASAGEPALTFASVYPFSTHSYELRYWLASAGINPDTDVNLTIVPPPLMVDALADGQIDGSCVGAPWSSISFEVGHSHIVALKADLWRQGPEKVLAVREHWADENPQTVSTLVQMLIHAAAWCSNPDNTDELAQLLSDEKYLGIDAGIIGRTLRGLILGVGEAPVENHLLFDPHRATYPWRSQALWFYAQMVRWRQIDHSEVNALAAKKAYRPDIYRKAFATIPLLGSALFGPAENALGARSLEALEADTTLFDQRLFDPDDLPGYFSGLGLNVSVT